MFNDLFNIYNLISTCIVIVTRDVFASRTKMLLVICNILECQLDSEKEEPVQGFVPLVEISCRRCQKTTKRYIKGGAGIHGYVIIRWLNVEARRRRAQAGQDHTLNDTRSAVFSEMPLQ